MESHKVEQSKLTDGTNRVLRHVVEVLLVVFHLTVDAPPVLAVAVQVRADDVLLLGDGQHPLRGELQGAATVLGGGGGNYHEQCDYDRGSQMWPHYVNCGGVRLQIRVRALCH